MPAEELHPKSLGAFYTPATIAGVLARWVVQSGFERLLEPSVGEGALIAAAVAQAQTINGGHSHLRFLACDINPRAIEAIISRLPTGSEARSVDFLQLDVASTGTFQGVIVNPPFTRNHAMSSRRRNVLRRRFSVVGAAGLWVHFLLHSLEFLADGGRLAAVVPASALFTSYGRAAMERVAALFREVEIYQIVDQPVWSSGAAERGAIILAGGFLQGTSTLPEATPWSTCGTVPLPQEEAGRVFQRLSAAATPLGSLAYLRIGIVTGCNSVFLMTEPERQSLGITMADVVPVVGRSRQVPGLAVTTAELADLAAQGERTWLLHPTTLGRRGDGVRRRLASISAARRQGTLWFAKRAPWWRVDIGEPGEAVFTYMNDCGPRLVLASEGVRATNTLHIARFSREVAHQQRLATSMSMISTFGQLASERHGRSYGGGVLKFELNEARKLPILPTPANELELAFLLADDALRQGNYDDARTIADEALVAPLLGPAWRSGVAALSDELERNRSLRQGRRA